MTISDTRSQPKPKANDNPAVWSLVMKDMIDRDSFGYAKYGVRLQAGNGRDFLIDAYQEALDLVVYLRGAIYERDNVAVHESLFSDPAADLPCNNPVRAFHSDPMPEPAAAMEDDSARMQAIGQNGNDGEHYATMMPPFDGANCLLESSSGSVQYAIQDDDNVFWSERGLKFRMGKWKVIRHL